MDIMRHTKEEITEAFDYLQSVSSSEEYRKHLIIIIDYITDLVELVEVYKKRSEDSSNLIYSITQKLIELNKSNSKNDKLKQFKKMELVRKIANEYEKTHGKIELPKKE